MLLLCEPQRVPQRSSADFVLCVQRNCWKVLKWLMCKAHPQTFRCGLDSRSSKASLCFSHVVKCRGFAFDLSPSMESLCITVTRLHEASLSLPLRFSTRLIFLNPRLHLSSSSCLWPHISSGCWLHELSRLTMSCLLSFRSSKPLPQFYTNLLLC